jgi:hypothetical protein
MPVIIPFMKLDESVQMRKVTYLKVSYDSPAANGDRYLTPQDYILMWDEEFCQCVEQPASISPILSGNVKYSE